MKCSVFGRCFFLACALLLAAWATPVYAQQTIFNVPSADVTPKGRVFVQNEAQTRFFGTQQYYNATQYAAVGIGFNTEIDTTLVNLSAPDSNNMSLGVGFKTYLPLLTKRYAAREFKWTTGTLVPISLDGRGVGNWTYTHLSGRLPCLNTRLTAGVNVGTRQIFGRNQVSAIAGVEQPIGKKLTVLADWYSGAHSSAYFIPGVSYALPKNITLYVGYQIPNNRSIGRSGLVFELAKLF